MAPLGPAPQRRRHRDRHCAGGMRHLAGQQEVEGGSTRDATSTKRLMYQRPEILEEFLRRLTVSIAQYAIFQANSGAQCIQIFDSWAHHLTPEQWLQFCVPYVKSLVEMLRAACPDVPVIYFANGGSAFLPLQVDELAGVVDVLSIDQHMCMADARHIVDGSGLVLQGNVDPYVLRYGDEALVRDTVRRTIDDAGGPGRHIMNLGHGVLQGTPEENVSFFVEEAQMYSQV
mmetsp:Transcript_100096/g.288994  ORF Transcript_100096/g.288994 Transcript_100096/m.288994 type:complete len:230 (+) Transcript_100096:1-690(+)